MKKRIVSFCIACFLLCSVMPLSVLALSDSITIDISTDECAPGEVVTIPITLNSNSGFVSMSLSVTYDTAALTLISCEYTDVISGSIHSANYMSPYKLTWENDILTSNITSTGTIVYLTFLVSEDVKEQDYSIIVRIPTDGILDANGDTVSASGATGIITVSAAHECLFGDWEYFSKKKHVRCCENGCDKEEYDNHHWDDGEMIEEPSHDTEGEIKYTCEDCDYSYTTEIDAEGHDWSDWTKLNDTQHRRTCSCGDVEYEEHNWDSGVITKQPTETEAGTRTYTCDDCAATYESLISATGHSYTSSIVKSTCQTKGYTLYVCEICGDSYKDNYVPELEHMYFNGKCIYCKKSESLVNMYCDLAVNEYSWYITNYQNIVTAGMNVRVSNYGTKTSSDYVVTVRSGSSTGTIVYQKSFVGLASGKTASFEIHDLDVSNTVIYYISVECAEDNKLSNNHVFDVIAAYMGGVDHTHSFSSFNTCNTVEHQSTCWECGEILKNAHWYPYSGAEECLICGFGGLQGCDLSIAGSHVWYYSYENTTTLNIELENVGSSASDWATVTVRKGSPTGEAILTQTRCVSADATFSWSLDLDLTTATYEYYYVSVTCDNDIDESNNYKLIVLDSRGANSDEVVHDLDFFVDYDDKCHVAYCLNDCDYSVNIPHWYPSNHLGACMICNHKRTTSGFNDFNLDGSVTIGDVTTLLDIMAGKAENIEGTDVNGDGVTTIGDVTALLDIMAGK